VAVVCGGKAEALKVWEEKRDQGIGKEGEQVDAAANKQQLPEGPAGRD